MDSFSTAVMIPTYNEAGNIGPLLDRLLAIREDLICLVVDDNSPDGTAKIVEQFASRFPGRVQLLKRSGRLGRASAGIMGLQSALRLHTPYIVEMDADFSHNPDYIPTFLKEIRDCDVVVGSRLVDGGTDATRSWFRTTVSKISGQTLRLILGLPVQDVGSGFKLYRREVLAALPWNDFYSRGISISMEELFRIARLGFRIKEVPIDFVDRRVGKSKLRLQDFVEPLKVASILAATLGRNNKS